MRHPIVRAAQRARLAAVLLPAAAQQLRRSRRQGGVCAVCVPRPGGRGPGHAVQAGPTMFGRRRQQSAAWAIGALVSHLRRRRPRRRQASTHPRLARGAARETGCSLRRIGHDEHRPDIVATGCSLIGPPEWWHAARASRRGRGGQVRGAGGAPCAADRGPRPLRQLVAGPTAQCDPRLPHQRRDGQCVDLPVPARPRASPAVPWRWRREEAPAPARGDAGLRGLGAIWRACVCTRATPAERMRGGAEGAKVVAPAAVQSRGRGGA